MSCGDNATPEHVFSVDVEEHFHALALERAAPRDLWPGLPSRVEPMTDLLLDLLARHGATGTFFVVGWVAERHPDLVRRIAAQGHEVGSHTWWHRRVFSQPPAEFRDEVRRTRALLQQLSGQPVLGFRAPSFSILPGCEWALDVLIEAGHRYDSSFFPIHRPGYGNPGSPPMAHRIERPAGELVELPMMTLPLLGVRLPASGGAYLRHGPYALTAAALRHCERAGHAGMLYIHPWEVDTGQPRFAVPWLTRVRHYGGLRRTLPLLTRLLSEFRFTSAARRHASLLDVPVPTRT